MEKPLLQFYTDETWGYDRWDEENKRKEGIRVKFQQEKGETRGAFFKRINLSPRKKEYGFDFALDQRCNKATFYKEKAKIAAEGYALEKLIKDESPLVRAEVARQGYGLERLVDDENWLIRAEVARQRVGLEVLVRDECSSVREEVAFQGYGLDILICDDHERVRRAVARQGYGLRYLVDDPHWLVRAEVARQGFGLNKLINDKDAFVIEEVFGYFREHYTLSLERWMEENPDKCAI